MVLASNKWLNNSGDDQKPSEVLTPANSVAGRPNLTHTQDQRQPNLMSTTKTADQGAAEKDSLSGVGVGVVVGSGGGSGGGGGGSAAQPLSSEPALFLSNINQNETTSSMNQRQEVDEQQKTIENILKAMASNENNREFVANDGAMDTTRTPNSNESDSAGEIENNNHAFTALIDGTFDNLIPTSTTTTTTKGLDASDDPTDSNINVIDNDTTVKGSNLGNLNILDDNVMATLSAGGGGGVGGVSVPSNKSDRVSFLNTLTNLNSTQTTTNLMNSTNALLSFTTSTASSSSASNKPVNPVNPVYALDAAAARPPPSIMNAANMNNSNLNTHIINGDVIGTVVQSAASSAAAASNGQAKIVLYCEQNSHPFQTRTILLTPNIECKVGRLIAKCKASESNAIFDCKVLSRNHAVLWFSDDGKFWVKDTKSSNGTFINDHKLGNDAAELHYGDTVKFGVDVLENSRKEVHGCIIASVKLYLPDGRQAISNDSSAQRSQYSGESRISFDDLHRLNVYMQETSQREKALKSKLHNIQNLLDATRKNSSTCWQAMISEDQLLHRIHSLEKKIQILEKNMPENALKNEILKLIDDKSAYQHSAKETLRGVYLERCETMQKLSKLEAEFAASEHESQILREQINSTEEALQDACERLRLLEIESNEHRNEAERQQLEAKMEFEEQIRELSEKLQERANECDALRACIAEVSSKQQKNRKDSHNDEEKLAKQAIENLDAVIAGMDMGDDDEEEDDDEEDDNENDGDDDDDGDDDEDDDEEEDAVDKDVDAALQGKRERHKASDVYDFNGSQGSHGKEKNTKKKHRGGGEATIMKWLKNSDLKMKEGSMDIINAICNNESDSSDEQETISPVSVDKNIKQRYARLGEKLNSLKHQLKHIEEGVKEYQTEKATVKTESHVDDVNGKMEEEEKGEGGGSLQMKLMKNVNSLNDAVEEVFQNYQQLREAIIVKEQHSPPTAPATEKIEKVNSVTKASVKSSLPEINEVDDEHDSEAEEKEDDDVDDDEENDVVEMPRKKVTTKQSTVQSANILDNSNAIIDHLKSEVEELKTKLNDRDVEAQHMLEMLQIECETHKTKVDELLKVTEEMQQQQQHKLPAAVIDDISSGDGTSSDSGLGGIDKTTETTATQQPVMDASINTSMSGSGISDIESIEHATAATATAAAVFEQQMREDLDALNNSAVQREEELIAYKESLEESQKENAKLRNDLQRVKDQPKRSGLLLMQALMPIGAVVIAVLAYLSINYF